MWPYAAYAILLQNLYIFIILFTVDLLQNNFSAAIPIFWLRLAENFSTILKHCFKIFGFGSPKIWKSRNESYFAKGLMFSGF